MKKKCKACKSPATCRGLCWPCYMAAWRRVETGETTWDQLVQLGLADESKRKAAAFTEMMNKRMGTK